MRSELSRVLVEDGWDHTDNGPSDDSPGLSRRISLTLWDVGAGRVVPESIPPCVVQSLSFCDGCGVFQLLRSVLLTSSCSDRGCGDSQSEVYFVTPSQFTAEFVDASKTNNSRYILFE